MGRIVKDLYENKHNGYNPHTGIYLSNTIFKGNFDQEITKQQVYDVPTTFKEIEQQDNKKGLQSNYKTVAFRSHDGKNTTYDAPGNFWDEENPASYQYTDAYHNSPNIRAMLDWFQVEKCRVRLFQLQAGMHTPMHTDIDNERGQTLGETLRIIIQLNDVPGGNWFRFRTADSDISIQLQQGQFVIFNPDNTAHQTNNQSGQARNSIMMVVKRNAWLDDLVNNTNPQVINVGDLQSKTAMHDRQLELETA